LVGGTQMQASPQQLPLLAMSSPHCLEEIAATAYTAATQNLQVFLK